MKYRYLHNWLKRLAAASHIDCYMFGMPDGTITYLPVGNALRGFGEAKDGPVSYEAETILNAQWSTCPKLYALMEAVRNPIESRESDRRTLAADERRMSSAIGVGKH